ncbi:MAG: DUF502 domain-containing protein [Gemmatimonas sp.]|jgi:uncharacterized membrane protein|uniref:DUF502 domain-containing protein n=1 Tax=Gemmatimonas sp. TaxID=1962908 RepID=UPI00391F0C0D|nr:DUF502 domain-containing protein [Gemmatimonadota bacterium]
MRRILGYFARGLVLLAPLAVTVWICWIVFTNVDGWLGLPIPGAGFVATLVLITLVGFLGSNLLTRSMVSALEGLLGRLPFVRLLYGSTKDLLNAFVGEKRRFDKPVLVSVVPDGSVKLMGFLTQESLHHLGLADQVTVYCPHSYNFSGQLYVVSASQVQPLDVTSADAMAFVVSGGVAGIVPAALSTGEYASLGPLR